MWCEILHRNHRTAACCLPVPLLHKLDNVCRLRHCVSNGQGGADLKRDWFLSKAAKVVEQRPVFDIKKSEKLYGSQKNLGNLRHHDSLSIKRA